MDAFFEALTAGENKIPRSFDWFAPLLGDWDFTYTDGLGGGRTVQGEWLFRRALNGAGIEDLFICPSRATRADNPPARRGVRRGHPDVQRQSGLLRHGLLL